MVAESGTLVDLQPPTEQESGAITEDSKNNANNTLKVAAVGETSCDSGKQNTSAGSMSGQMHEVELEEEVSFDISPSESKRGLDETEESSAVPEPQRESSGDSEKVLYESSEQPDEIVEETPRTRAEQDLDFKDVGDDHENDEEQAEYETAGSEDGDGDAKEGSDSAEKEKSGEDSAQEGGEKKKTIVRRSKGSGKGGKGGSGKGGKSKGRGW